MHFKETVRNVNMAEALVTYRPSMRGDDHSLTDWMNAYP